jgi:hypothetical protein
MRRALSKRRVKYKLLSMLIRYDHGERQVWQVVKVPSVEAEDQRYLPAMSAVRLALVRGDQA